MSKLPKNSTELPTSSAVSLADLQRLQKPTQKTMETTQSAMIVHPGNGNAGSIESISKSPKNRKRLDTFEQAVGGREALVETLEFATLTDKESHLLNLLQDPGRQNDSLAIILKHSGIPTSHFMDLYKSASMIAANSVIMSRLAESTPSIVDDMVDKSIDAKVECPKCFNDEFKRIDCDMCFGKGKVFRGSDLDRQKLLLEAAGIVKKGGGVNVQVNQQVNNLNPGNFFSKFVRSTDNDAYDVIDTEAKEASHDE